MAAIPVTLRWLLVAVALAEPTPVNTTLVPAVVAILPVRAIVVPALFDWNSSDPLVRLIAPVTGTLPTFDDASVSRPAPVLVMV